MVLAHLCLEAGLSFGIGHCNFSLRGAESDGDEQFVRDWALSHNIPFYSTRFDTASIAEELKTGIQETARKLRYDWLEHIRSGNGYASIATAHHAQDNAETLLINLFRGTGISGLHGIPERNGRIIRPLLFAAGTDIDAYVAEKNIAFREDSSNSSDKYLRNALRMHILPVAEQYFPGVVQNLNSSIGRFAQAEQVYRKAMDKMLAKLKDNRGGEVYIPVLKLLKTAPLETTIYELFQPYGFGPAQVDEIFKLAISSSGKFMESDTHRLIRDRNFLILTAKKAPDTGFYLVDNVPGKLTAGKHEFSFSLHEKPVTITPDSNVAFIDADMLQYPLILRKWRTGDYFYPLGMGMKKKKLSRFFIDQKIPLHRKEEIWVLEDHKRIVWVAGLRLDERYRVDESTKKLLKVTMSPGISQ